ncbi:MAG: hypothetical protein Q4P15_13415 [Propionibacteriaceae bacterium]|nr:hypothetical protein [Propionibacteriaceae bacterium]
MAFHRRGEHPTHRARRRGLGRRSHVHHPGAVVLEQDGGNCDTVQPEQPIRSHIDVLNLNAKLRTLGHARDLTFVTMNCSTQS